MLTVVSANTCMYVQVRMLTGISRYNEMSYIIGLLIEADEFERLVHTGVEKVSAPNSISTCTSMCVPLYDM